MSFNLNTLQQYNKPDCNYNIIVDFIMLSDLIYVCIHAMDCLYPHGTCHNWHFYVDGIGKIQLVSVLQLFALK
jgi:hypothetical protein